MVGDTDLAQPNNLLSLNLVYMFDCYLIFEVSVQVERFKEENWVGWISRQGGVLESRGESPSSILKATISWIGDNEDFKYWMDAWDGRRTRFTLAVGYGEALKENTNTKQDHGDVFRIIDIDAEKEHDNHGNMS